MMKVALPRVGNLGACGMSEARIVARNGNLLVIQCKHCGVNVTVLKTFDGEHKDADLLNGTVEFAALSPNNKYVFLLSRGRGYLFQLDEDRKSLLESHIFKDLPRGAATAIAVSDDGVMAIGTNVGYVHTYVVDGHPVHDERYIDASDAVSEMAFLGNRLYVLYGGAPRVLALE